MRTKYGFKGIYLEPASYQNYLNAGYNCIDMMIAVHPYNWQSVIDNYSAGFYYVGDPADHECDGEWNTEWGECLNLIPQIHNHCGGSKLVVDGHKLCPHFIEVVNDADIVMYSSYHTYYWIGTTECWSDWPYNCGDQRDNWTAFRSTCGAKFCETWIGGHQCTDQDPHNGCLHGDGNEEIPNLLGHASNLGLTGVWLFCGCGTETSRIEMFCYHAWNNHYLRRFEREYYIWYQCTIPGGCPEDPPGNGWQYLYTEYGTTREVIPQ